MSGLESPGISFFYTQTLPPNDTPNQKKLADCSVTHGSHTQTAGTTSPQRVIWPLTEGPELLSSLHPNLRGVRVGGASPARSSLHRGMSLRWRREKCHNKQEEWEIKELLSLIAWAANLHCWWQQNGIKRFQIKNRENNNIRISIYLL